MLLLSVMSKLLPSDLPTSSIQNFPTSLPYFLDITCNYVFSSQAWLSIIHALVLALHNFMCPPACMSRVHCAATSPLGNLLPACCGEEQTSVTDHVF